MKKAIKILWGITIIAVLVFVISLICGANIVGSDAALWRIFSITMPIASISFYGAIILFVIDSIRSKK